MADIPEPLNFGSRELNPKMFFRRHDELNVGQGVPLIHIGGSSFRLQNDVFIVQHVYKNVIHLL